MQKLLKRNTYTPIGASQACSNCDYKLNKVERPSAYNLKTFNNISDVNHRQHTGGQSLRITDIVYVLSINGKPLMPTKQQHSRKLLKGGKAKVVKRSPFTIQLTVPSGEKVQKVTLGVDTGYKTIGFSAVSEKQELISGELELDGMTSKRLSERKMYRRNRRNKLWYRKSRFLNRKKSELMPSIQRRYDTHINLINRIKKILPITKIIVETANFDIQKIKNPNIDNFGYQEGEQKDFYNVKTYILHRDNYTCQYCKKKDKKLHVHHIIFRSKGGTDKPDNLITLCKKCHDKLHKNKIKLKVKPRNNFKPETFMSTIYKKLANELNCDSTYGYLTKYNREKLGLPKNHYNDAFVISGGNSQIRVKPINIKQKHKNNRKIQLNRKGFKPSIRRQRYKYQPKDIVKYNGNLYEVVGVHCKGSRIMIKNLKGKIGINVKKIDWHFNFNTLAFVI